VGLIARKNYILCSFTKKATSRAELAEREMARNTGEGFRRGSVNNRTQVFNPRTETWTKRDPDTGRFMQGKEDGSPFKGAAKEVDHQRSPE
jgi:hypothetical protein